MGRRLSKVKNISALGDNATVTFPGCAVRRYAALDDEVEPLLDVWAAE